ncbi:MAG: DNA-O6-methylguanine-protein-cysteine S-methyltransferase/DNA-3-methyladenine glycosylase Ada/AlkA [Pseudomonadota bacterium]|jgi:AraC family transcriptional regulator of adaptative response / DNA-3-methyladenine glycosylase II
MPLDSDAAYLALVARDARFDGRLFVGVTSTGVYCRPVCRVRTPRRENCRFFTTPAQAEAARFRPCLKCRPEIAPGLSHTDSSRTLADYAALSISQAVHAGRSIDLAELAARLGVTDRHLRRIFKVAHGVAPRDYIATQRLLLAKQLLTDTQQAVTEVALASGYDSLRRFNAAFVEHYRLRPSQLRREHAARLPPLHNPNPAAQTSDTSGGVHPGPCADSGPVLRLAYRPPYDLNQVLGFFARRTIQGVEEVDGLELRRTVAWQHGSERVSGWLSARFVPQRCEVHVVTSPTLAPVLGQVLHGVRRLLDLDADPQQIDPVLTQLPLPPRPGVRLPGCLDGFELAVRVILGQQVTVKAARTLVQRLVARFGAPLDTPFMALSRLFPTAEGLAKAAPDEIGQLGIVRQRVRALQSLAQAVLEGRLRLEPGADLEPTLSALCALPGIGAWTAQLVAMRALAWPDAWPAADIGLMNALGSRDTRHLTQLAEAWRPWRAYAVMRLWHHLEQPDMKHEEGP